MAKFFICNFFFYNFSKDDKFLTKIMSLSYDLITDFFPT